MPSDTVVEELPKEKPKLYMICKEHVWTSTIKGAYCPECSQASRAKAYRQQFAEAEARRVDRENQFVGISG